MGTRRPQYWLRGFLPAHDADAGRVAHSTNLFLSHVYFSLTQSSALFLTSAKRVNILYTFSAISHLLACVRAHTLQPIFSLVTCTEANLITYSAHYQSASYRTLLAFFLHFACIPLAVIRVWNRKSSSHH